MASQAFVMFRVFAAALCLGVASGQMVRREAKASGETDLRAALEGVLGGVPAQRLFAVEASIRPSFEAFQKNNVGRIPAKEIFPALVRGYFAKDQGWLIKGFEPPSVKPTTTYLHQAHVLQDRAPMLAKALMRAHESDRGLSLSDVVTTIAALESLLLDESAALLRGAYELNAKSTEDEVDEETVHDLLTSYLLIFRHGNPRDLTNSRMHLKMKARAMKSKDWEYITTFEHHAVLNHGHQGLYPFKVALEIAKDMAQRFGKWQNAECVEMKKALTALDAKHSGRVPFGAFHGEPNHPSFQFSESEDYLRKIGALDESDSGKPEVRIANYLVAPSNCIASSEYFSICCLNDCERLMSEVEYKAQAPEVPLHDVLDIAGEIWSSSLDSVKRDPEALAAKLTAIADSFVGVVPLHSAGFRGWLHDAFPGECPYPTSSENAAEESERAVQQEWHDLSHNCTRLPEWHSTLEVLNV